MNELMILLLVCVCITLGMWGMKGHYQHDLFEETACFVWAVQLSLMVALIAFIWQQGLEKFETLSVGNAMLQVWIGTAVVMGILVVKQVLLRWVNYVFFGTKNEGHETWLEKYRKILRIESTFFLVLCFVEVFYPQTLRMTLELLLITFICVKILIIRTDLKTIFRDFRAILHFFVYLCALELLPILVCGVFLVRIYG